MHPDWKQRLFKAIEDDARSDRAISLAAKLGANFIGQMRGSEASPPKEPTVQNVLALASELNISPTDLFSGTHVTRPVNDEAEIRSFLERVEGLSETDVNVTMAVIRNALGAKRGAPERSAPHDQQQVASPRRESTPSKRQPQRSDV